MGKSTGFLEYEREVGRGKTPEDRIKNWNEFHASLSEEEQRRRGPDAWTAVYHSASQA